MTDDQQSHSTDPGAHDGRTARDAQRSAGDPSRTDLAQPDHTAGTNAEEPRSIDLGARSFANTNIAPDQERQGRERGAGLGAGGSQTRDARHGAPEDQRGDVPEDDLD
jgi:hypothetical protein